MPLRPPTPQDATAVQALLVARDRIDLGRSDSILDDLLEEWSNPHLDTLRDLVVDENESGEITGYAIVRRMGTFAAVSPDHEEEGIGAGLLDWCERRQRELGWRRHATAIGGANARGRELLERNGYSKIRSYWRMAVQLGEVTPAKNANEQVSLREVDPIADSIALHALDAEAFASVGGTEPESLEEFSDEHLKGHDLDPSLGRVADLAGEMVGFALTRRWVEESSAFVDILAVAPAHHGEGIGKALLTAVFAAAAAAGLEEVQLGVAGDNPKALRLYEGLGMRPRFRRDVFERPVD